jgi:hypothetical protein
MKRHTDAEDYAGAGPLFEQPEEGPFGRSKLPPTALERDIAERIWRHRGRANAISIARLTQETGLSDRTIKQQVETLVDTHRMRIGGYREDPAGYAIIETAEDLAAAVGPYKAQALAMLRRLRVLESPEGWREFLGQLRLEVEG